MRSGCTQREMEGIRVCKGKSGDDLFVQGEQQRGSKRARQGE